MEVALKEFHKFRGELSQKAENLKLLLGHPYFLPIIGVSVKNLQKMPQPN